MSSVEHIITRLTELKGSVLTRSKAELGETLREMVSSCNTAIALHEAGILATEDSVQVVMDSCEAKIVRVSANSMTRQERKQFKKQIADCELAITTADYLLADTGTIVFLEPTHKSRLLTLLPPAVIVVIEEEKILSSLVKLYEFIDKNSSKPFLFTGPSRTADIEKKLVLGVHGPEKLTVLLVRG
ncbi:MAG: LutC/YkgG family protein [Calditrichia bacterium]